MTTTTGATGDIEYRQVVINDHDEIIVLRAKVANLEEHIEIMGETLNQNNLTMIEQDKIIDKLRAALEAVEYDVYGICLWCDGDKESAIGHSPDCQRQAALKSF